MRETILRITTAMKVIDVHRIVAGRARKSLRRNNLKTVSGWKINKRMKSLINLVKKLQLTTKMNLKSMIKWMTMLTR